MIDRTAAFFAKSANPVQLEEKIRESQRNDPKFSFLNPADPYHAYYRNCRQRVAAGETLDSAVAAEGEDKADAPAAPQEPMDIGKEPPHPEFILDLPNISAVDL